MIFLSSSLILYLSPLYVCVCLACFSSACIYLSRSLQAILKSRKISKHLTKQLILIITILLAIWVVFSHGRVSEGVQGVHAGGGRRKRKRWKEKTFVSWEGSTCKFLFLLPEEKWCRRHTLVAATSTYLRELLAPDWAPPPCHVTSPLYRESARTYFAVPLSRRAVNLKTGGQIWISQQHISFLKK